MPDLGSCMVGGYIPTSFLDWEGRVAAVIFTSGCNFRCPWCHNAELALGRAEGIPLQGVLTDIKRRAKFLDGIVITGGEPTLWPGLQNLLKELREAALPAKLDTNGSNPDVLRKILEDKLTAHVEMDVKAPFDDIVLSRVTGVQIQSRVIEDSVRIIKSLAASYSFRTTWSPHILSEAELRRIAEDLEHDPCWVIQPFVPVNCLDPKWLDFPKTEPEEIRRILPNVRIRG